MSNITYGDLMSDEQIDRYVRGCLFAKDHDVDYILGIDRIELHNAKLESMLLKERPGAKKVEQKNPREPTFLDGKTLLSLQWSGPGRRARYEDRIRIWLERCVAKMPEYKGHQIEFESLELPHERGEVEPELNTINWYDNHAYDFTKQILKCHKDEMRSLDAIVIGPLDDIADIWEIKEPEKIRSIDNEYSDYKLIDLDGRTVLGFNYLFGDQSRILLSKVLKSIAALNKAAGTHQDLDILSYGRVAGLGRWMNRNDTIIPQGIVDESNVHDKKMVLHMENIMGDTYALGKLYDRNCRVIPGGHILNVFSVVRETRRLLEIAQAMGASCAEMEALGAVEAIAYANRTWRDHLHVDSGFAGYVSDLPLKGDTLADELTDDSSRIAILGAFKDVILHRR